MAKIMLVDDHAVVREGVRTILEDSGDYTCAQAVSAEDALQQMHAGQVPDAVLLDLTLPGMNGLDAMARMHAEWPRLPVLLLSMHLEEHYATRALRLGAKGYLNKSAPAGELLAAIKSILKGESYLSRNFAARVASGAGGDAEQPLHETLSNREFEILRLIGFGMPVSEIARKLDLSVKTVSTYRERVLCKMNFTNNFDIIRYVLQNGLAD